MLTIFYKTLKDKKFKESNKLRPGSWINVVAATNEDIEQVAELAGLQLIDLRDTMDRYELPRVERQEEGIIIYTRYPTEDSEELFTELMTIVLTGSYLITISPTKNPLIERMLEQSTSIATTQKTKLVIKLLLRIAQDYTLKTKQVGNKVPRGRRELKRIKSNDFLILAESEEILNQYLSALIPLNNALETVISKKYVPVYAEDEDILQDLIIAFRQSADLCGISLKSIKNIRESYQVIFTNNLNKIIKILTVLTILLTIPTMIGGLYGMNVLLPFQDDPLAFAYIIWVTVTLCAITFFIFYYKKWL